MAPVIPDTFELDDALQASDTGPLPLQRRLDTAMGRIYTPDYQRATVLAYCKLDFGQALAKHNELLSRCRGYLADSHMQELYRAFDPHHDPAPEHPTIAHMASAAIALNRHISECLDPDEGAWTQDRRNDIEAACLIPLAEMAAGTVRLRHKHQAAGAGGPQTAESENAAIVDHRRYLSVTTGIKCSSRSARALVDLQAGMDVEQAYDCFRFTAGDNSALQKDLDFYWEQAERLVGSKLDESSLTDLYILAQKEQPRIPLALLFRLLLVIPMAELYRQELLDGRPDQRTRPASELDRRLARVGA